MRVTLLLAVLVSAAPSAGWCDGLQKLAISMDVRRGKSQTEPLRAAVVVLVAGDFMAYNDALSASAPPLSSPPADHLPREYFQSAGWIANERAVMSKFPNMLWIWPIESPPSSDDQEEADKSVTFSSSSGGPQAVFVLVLSVNQNVSHSDLMLWFKRFASPVRASAAKLSWEFVTSRSVPDLSRLRMSFVELRDSLDQAAQILSIHAVPLRPAQRCPVLFVSAGASTASEGLSDVLVETSKGIIGYRLTFSSVK